MPRHFIRPLNETFRSSKRLYAFELLSKDTGGHCSGEVEKIKCVNKDERHRAGYQQETYWIPHRPMSSWYSSSFSPLQVEHGYHLRFQTVFIHYRLHSINERPWCATMVTQISRSGYWYTAKGCNSWRELNMCTSLSFNPSIILLLVKVVIPLQQRLCFACCPSEKVLYHL